MNIRCKIPILTTQAAHRPPILYNEGYNMLTKKEFDILVLLTESKEPMSQREIAEALGISLGAVNKAMQELTEKGCCEKGVILQAGLDALEPYRVKRAVFIAAGFGSRMVPITFNTPKPLVRVNGTRIIDTLLDAVVAAGIPEIVIVRGYLGEQFDQLLYKYPNIRFVEAPVYNEANNIASAVCVRYLLQNAYVLEADLVLRNKHLIEHSRHPRRPDGRLVSHDRLQRRCHRGNRRRAQLPPDGRHLLLEQR